MKILGPNNIIFNVTDSRDLIATHLVNKIIYESMNHYISKTILRNRQGLIIDVGANIGSYSLLLAKAFPAHRFHCFEIQPQIFDYLTESIQDNGFTNIQTYQIGLSDNQSQMQVKLPNYAVDGNVGAFSLKDEYKSSSVIGEQEATIQLTTLDSYNFDNVALIKIDVEGMEREVLQGSVNTISRCKPAIIFEAWDTDSYKDKKQELIDFVADLGYNVIDYGNNCLAY